MSCNLRDTKVVCVINLSLATDANFCYPRYDRRLIRFIEEKTRQISLHLLPMPTAGFPAAFLCLSVYLKNQRSHDHQTSNLT